MIREEERRGEERREVRKGLGSSAWGGHLRVELAASGAGEEVKVLHEVKISEHLLDLREGDVDPGPRR